VRARELDERTVIRSVILPGSRGREEVALGDHPREILVEHGLRVALEHFEREDDAPRAIGAGRGVLGICTLK